MSVHNLVNSIIIKCCLLKFQLHAAPSHFLSTLLRSWSSCAETRYNSSKLEPDCTVDDQTPSIWKLPRSASSNGWVWAGLVKNGKNLGSQFSSILVLYRSFLFSHTFQLAWFPIAAYILNIHSKKFRSNSYR